MVAHGDHGDYGDRDTIYALSSGLPPAGIAVIRVSGVAARSAIVGLARTLPLPRMAKLMWLCDPVSQQRIDQALVLWFPAPASVTGDDIAEFHVHGGRAVVARTLLAIAAVPGTRPAVAGEFTRRAFENGRIDLAQAEGLADLLAAETESQRQSALRLAEGGLGALVNGWRTLLLSASAHIEASIEFSDEGDVDDGSAFGEVTAALLGLHRELVAMQSDPPAERLRDGVRVVLAGPPNTGKSSLLNALVSRDAAIVSPQAGTTRDRIDAVVSIKGIPMIFTDTAGIRGEAGDDIEAIGMARARQAAADADIVLWLGNVDDCAIGELGKPIVIDVVSRADLVSDDIVRRGLRVSVVSGEGLSALRDVICDTARSLLPRPGALALNARHRSIIDNIATEIAAALRNNDSLIIAEHLRTSLKQLDALIGRAGIEDMLDALFGNFCIGK